MQNAADIITGDVLIVDDNPENLAILRYLLELNGYRVQSALNGEIALKIVQSSPPDIILLDIQMPGMNGFEVCKRLKADEPTKQVPVIFISALSELDDKVKAFSLGAVDYIPKPFHAEEILARVKTHLSLRSLQKKLEERNNSLEKALAEIKTLHGIIPICASCKQIRDDKGFWRRVEDYIAQHSDAVLSHGICPDCADKLYPDFKLYEQDP